MPPAAPPTSPASPTLASDSPPAQRAHPVAGFLFWLLLCILTSAVGALASANARSFYADLVSPDWAPPGWVFGPVWSVLFFLMAVAAWLVWRLPQNSRARTVALGLFVVQLVANAAWSWLFFGAQLGAIAFAEVLLLWSLIAATALAFWRLQRSAGWLLLPYLGWVTFAAVLNYTLWRSNPGLLG